MMSSFPSSQQYFRRATLLVTAIFISILFCACSGNKPTVERAYDLRMVGNADSALALLEQVIADDSSNAAAWFEMARTRHHLGLGNPRLLFGSIAELDKAATKATTLEPDNLTYACYHGYISFFNSYIAFMGDQEMAKVRVATTVAAYERVIELEPEFLEPRLFLIELLSAPADLGGDSLQAQLQASELADMDPVMGARGEELLLPDEIDRVAYWTSILNEYPGEAAVIEQLGKAYLYDNQVEEGMRQLELAYETAPGNHLLLLDIARFYLMTSRQDSTQTATVLPRAAAAINRYLETGPINPLRAFASNMMAWVKTGLDLEQEAAELRKQAEELDSSVSKAFGIPPMLLFSGLEEVSHYHSYFFRPF
jgi:tetratricopeptide (TPR) repeat protein